MIEDEIMRRMNKQIKSKERVSNHGEVFTAEREVNAMLDLVKNETERIDSRFLEPACGSGNFLIEILNRKLKTVASKYKKFQSDWERYTFIGVSSIYGVDILEDNVLDCRERLFEIVDKEYKKLFKENCKDEFKEVVSYLLEKNIIWGDALTMLQVSKGNEQEPITFSEWSAINHTGIKRRDYTLSHLLETAKYDNEDQLDLFVDYDKKFDERVKAIPRPVSEYPVTHYLKIKETSL